MINCINEHYLFFSQGLDRSDNQWQASDDFRFWWSADHSDTLLHCRTHMHGLWCRTDRSFATFWLDRYRPIGARARERASRMKVVARSRHPDAEQNVDICERRCGRSSTSRRANVGTRSEPRSEQSRMLLLFSVYNNTNKASSTQLTINTFYSSTHLQVVQDQNRTHLD